MLPMDALLHNLNQPWNLSMGTKIKLSLLPELSMMLITTHSLILLVLLELNIQLASICSDQPHFKIKNSLQQNTMDILEDLQNSKHKLTLL